jgi:hypothetical protein
MIMLLIGILIFIAGLTIGFKLCIITIVQATLDNKMLTIDDVKGNVELFNNLFPWANKKTRDKYHATKSL